MNKTRIRQWIIAGFGAWAIPFFLLTGAVYAADQSPQALIQSITDNVLDALQTDGGKTEQDPVKLVSLMERRVVPHLDIRFMATQVLARYWRSASDTQRQQFTEEFKQLLTNSYAAVFRRYANQKVAVLAAQTGEPPDRSVVPTIIKSSGAPDIRVDYRVRRSHDKWLVYDVVVDGISLLINYRSEYSSYLQQNTLDELITRLKEKNAGFVRNKP